MKPRVLAIVGVGLIGGSVGLAVRRIGSVRILGVDRDADALRLARQRGIVDEACADVAAAARLADFILFCSPVDTIAEQVLAAGTACQPGTILTDTGSTKEAIVRAVDGRLPAGVTFVGGHPLAGSEKQGSDFADPELFRNRLVVLTPTAATDQMTVARVQAFWESLGARVRCTSPQEHDRSLALTSHLPHLLASALAGILPAELTDLTATGFRDMTRIADSDAALWSAILLANRAPILKALAKFDGRLQEFRSALASGDRKTVHALLTAGCEARRPLQGGA
jgi:cyclohexadieny/prephenate dehydrogenase